MDTMTSDTTKTARHAGYATIDAEEIGRDIRETRGDDGSGIARLAESYTRWRSTVAEIGRDAALAALRKGWRDADQEAQS